MKKIELSQKELDKMLGEERQKGYEMGMTHGRAEQVPWKKQQAIKGIILLDALISLLDERYQFKEEDY